MENWGSKGSIQMVGLMLPLTTREFGCLCQGIFVHLESDTFGIMYT